MTRISIWLAGYLPVYLQSTWFMPSFSVLFTPSDCANPISMQGWALTATGRPGTVLFPSDYAHASRSPASLPSRSPPAAKAWQRCDYEQREVEDRETVGEGSRAGPACGLVFGMVVLIGGRLWQPQADLAKRRIGS